MQVKTGFENLFFFVRLFLFFLVHYGWGKKTWLGTVRVFAAFTAVAIGLAQPGCSWSAFDYQGAQPEALVGTEIAPQLLL